MIRALECFMFCQREHLCMAFQMCGEKENRECQLLSSDQFQSPSTLVTMIGCSYCDMQPASTSSSVSNKPSCGMEYISCQNGGTVETLDSANYTTPRQKCNCLPGYAGNLCQDVVKSCRGYISGSRVPGKYKVFADDTSLFEVFCDFELISTMAWTLVQSYQLQNADLFMKSYSQDNSINENSPRWDSYRLSKSRMESIRNKSSKWRMTCQYDTQGVVYTDYMESRNKKIDVLTYVEESPFFTCSRDKHEVDFVNIRGQSCSNCTAPIVQGIDNIFHLDTYYPTCDFKPTGALYCDGRGEDNFGRYICVNSLHRCSSSPTATTQTWLGGH